MSTYSHRFFMKAIIAVPLLLWFFGCNTIDNSMNAPPELKMAKSSKNGDPVRILCLGNSFTFGVNGDHGKRNMKGGYRPYLFYKLLDANKNIEFVGDNHKNIPGCNRGLDGGWQIPKGAEKHKDKDGKVKEQRNHEGYDGQTIEQITAAFFNKKQLDEHKPDIILLHVGHNTTPEPSMRTWEERANALDDLYKRIKAWGDQSGNNPPHVILAKVVSMTKDNPKKTKYTDKPPYNYQGLESYNRMIESLYRWYKKKKHNKIHLVDMSDKWKSPTESDWISDELWKLPEEEWILQDKGITVKKGKDGVHPIDEGFGQMADIWFNKIKTVIDKHFPERSKKDEEQSSVKRGHKTEISKKDKNQSPVKREHKTESSKKDKNQNAVEKGHTKDINIEAEDMKYCSWIRGSFVENNHRGHTGKGFVNTPNHTGAWTQCKVKVKAAGSYRIEVRYANGSSGRAAKLIVNGTAEATGAFASTGNWGKWGDEIFTGIPLKSGTNTVRLSANTWGGLGNIDHFSLDVSGEGSSKKSKKNKNQNAVKKGHTKEINIEAEDKADCSWIRGSSVDNNHRGYKGKGFVNTPNHTGAWMQCDVKVKAAGSYRIEVRYANGSSGRPAQLIVNGKAKVTGAFASTGNWEKWNDEIFKNIPLKAGTNKVRLSAKAPGGLGNIDYFDFSK